MCRKYDKDIMLILDTYNSQRKKFRIGKSYVPFTANDVSLIFGIPNGTRPLDLKYAKKQTSDFIARRFQDSPRVSTLQIKQQLQLALNGITETDVADVARLLCLYILVIIFFSTHGNTIGWAYVGYIENYMYMKHYAWPEEISKFLMESVHSRSRGSDRVIGCLIALPYWLCEHTTIVKPTETICSPRIAKWNLRELTMALRKRPLQTLQANEVLCDTLETILIEEQVLLSLLDITSHKEGHFIEIDVEEQTEEKDNSEGDEIVEEDQQGGYDGDVGEEQEGDEGDKEEEQKVEDKQEESEKKMIEATQPDIDIMEETLVVSELEEQAGGSNSEEPNITGVASQSTSFGVEMTDYEQMALQTELVVANILADIVGSISDEGRDVPSKNQSGSEPATVDTMPCPTHLSQSTEDSNLKKVSEERDSAISLANQLTKEKAELQAQIHRMANDLEKTAAEKNSLNKERLEIENRITSLIRERDDALLLVEQLTKEKTSLETHNLSTHQSAEESSRLVSSLKEQLKHTINVSEVHSSRATKAEKEVKGLKKKLITLESNNFKLQQLLREMTIQYTEKGLEWAGKKLDDIFQPSKKIKLQEKGCISTDKTTEDDASVQTDEGNNDKGAHLESGRITRCII